MIDKRKKDKFGNGLIAFLFICIIFLLCYAFKNPTYYVMLLKIQFYYIHPIQK